MSTGVTHGSTTESILTADPVGLIHPKRLCTCFDGQLSDNLAERLKASRRLKDRLGALIRRHYGLSQRDVAEVDEQDLIIASAAPEHFEKIALGAGSIYWSGAIAGAVKAVEVAALYEALGEDICAYAVKNRDLAGPPHDLAPIDTIRVRVEADGWRCLSAWCETLGRALDMRIRLKLAPNAAFDDPLPEEFRNCGPHIVRRITSI